MVKPQFFRFCEVYSHGFESRCGPTVNSDVHPSKVGKRVLRCNSEGTSTGHTLIAAILKFKCFIQYKY